MPTLWDDQKDLLHAFNDNGVEYVIVGGHAVSHHAEPRATKDLDLLLRNTNENAEAVYRALAAFGAPLHGLTPQELLEPESVFQIGVEPSRIDLLNRISGVSTEQAWHNRITGHITEDRIPANFISSSDLLLTKRATGRLQDLADAEKIQATQEAIAAEVNADETEPGRNNP